MSPTILVVDDDRSLCQILAKTFELEGWNVVVAHDGDDAVAKARTVAPDLLLLDLLLPKRDGFAVLEAIRAESGPVAETPAIYLTGCSRTKQYEERAEKLRAAAFLTKPVALDALREVTAKAVSMGGGARRGAAATRAPGRPPAAPRTATQGARPGVQAQGAAAARTLAGDLSELSFPALLHHLHGLRATGVLHLHAGKKRKAVQFRDGYPAAVKSNLVSECLGNMLRRSDKITPEELEESIRRVKSGEGLQGEILVAMALLSEPELVQALRDQAEEKLFELFEWRAGAFRFELGARLEGANALSLDGGPANLILDGVRKRFPLDVIDAHLATLADRFLAPNESPFHRFQDIDLDPGEDFLLRALDGRIRLRDLGEQGEATRRTLYGLIITGLLEARGRVEVAPPAGSASAQPVAPSRPAPARLPLPTPPAPRPADEVDVALRAELTSLAERLRGKGYFEVLGVPEKANDEDVRRSYVELAKKTHPDRFSNASENVRKLAEEIFGLVSKAYETLGDARRRTQYLIDQKGSKQAAADLEEGQRALAAEIQFQNGEAKLRRRDFDGAIQDFEWAVRLFPEEGEYVAYLGWALFCSKPNDLETLKKAITIVKKGSKLAEDRDKPYLFLGRMYQSAGKLDAAERMFTTALEIRSDNLEALRELRLIHMRREKERGLIGRLFRR